MSTEQQLRRTPITHEKGVWLTLLIPTITTLLAALIMVRLGASGVSVPNEASPPVETPRPATMSALPMQSITNQWVNVTTQGDCHLQADITNPIEMPLDIQIRSDAGLLSYEVPALTTQRFSFDYFTRTLSVFSGPDHVAIMEIGPADISCLGNPARLATVSTPAVARSLTRTKLLP